MISTSSILFFSRPAKKARPFKPIIITKDKLQKEVYGLGYPSIPVLSVEEFYDQRVKEGWFPDPGIDVK